MQVPDNLRRFGNGRIPETALAPVGIGEHRLARDAAAAFVRMRADASAAGVAIGLEDSYRTYDEQVDLARRKGLYSQGGLAAAPGSSNHGWGLAIDVDVDARGQQWLRDNGHRYGFVEDVPREPWHWTYRPDHPTT
jgi:LAS superfamily LD-carboxypeptidase LdcB